MQQKPETMCYLRLLITLFAILLSSVVNADIKTSLETFNKSQTAANANRLLKELKAEGLFDEEVKYGDNTPTDTLRAQVWYWAGEWYYDQQQYSQAVVYGTKALPLCKNGGPEADCLNLLAISNFRLSNYDEAARYAKQCYVLDEASGDPDVMSSSLNTIAAIYLGAKQPQEAEKYILKAIEKATEADNPTRMAVLQGMASEIFHAQDKDDEALAYVDRAIAIDQQLGNDDKVTVRLVQKASIFIGQKQFGKAEEILSRVIPSLRESGNRLSLGIACNKMGIALLSQKRPDEAVPYFREAADIFFELGDGHNEVYSQKGLYESLWKSDPDEAKSHLDRFNTLKDSIYNNVSAETLARYNAEFGNDWLEIDNHTQRLQKWEALTLAVIIAIIGVCVWLIMRRRNLRQKAINAKLRADLRQLNEQYRQLNIQYDNAMKSRNQEEPETDDEKEVSAADREFLEKTVNTINQLISDGGIDATTVAASLGMSLFQFRQRLARVTDETPQSFIQMIRMQRARHLLDHHPELNINEIAMLCAYNDTPNFTRAFKKTVGMTPTQYLEREK